jgi:two-component system OmpR family sensor kinase
MSLRARLLLVMVLTLTVGLAVAGVATYRYLSSSLHGRVDDQLLASWSMAAGMLTHGDGRGPAGGRADGPLLPGTYAALVGEHGSIVADGYSGFSEPSPPVLPEWVATSAAGPPGTFFDAPSKDGTIGYRGLATRLEHAPGTVVMAVPLTEVDATLDRLVLAEVVVGGIVLAVAAALSLYLVRLGLRPLEGIGQTAGAIAEGDLSRRVEPSDPRTEVGRLGIALNSMLGQIESAFDERRESEERLRRFVADASHELRTPLTSIRGYAELFRLGADQRPEDLTKSMQRIEAEAARMGVLVDDLLLLARLDQGRPLEREPVDVMEVVAEAVEGAQAVEPDRPIAFSPGGRAMVEGDRLRLRQVMDNLLSNARVHTPSGSEVSVEVSEETDVVVVRLADRGPGMDDEAREHLFERFYRGDPSRSREHGGAGLGLSIVAAIVQAHGGDVSAAPRDGGGTVFEVRLPAASA